MYCPPYPRNTLVTSYPSVNPEALTLSNISLTPWIYRHSYSFTPSITTTKIKNTFRWMRQDDVNTRKAKVYGVRDIRELGVGWSWFRQGPWRMTSLLGRQLVQKENTDERQSLNTHVWPFPSFNILIHIHVYLIQPLLLINYSVQ